MECRAVDLDEAGRAGLEVTADEDPGGPSRDLDDSTLGIVPALPAGRVILTVTSSPLDASRVASCEM